MEENNILNEQVTTNEVKDGAMNNNDICELDANYSVSTNLTTGEKAVLTLSGVVIAYSGYIIGKAIFKGSKKLKAKLEAKKAVKSTDKVASQDVNINEPIDVECKDVKNDEE